MKVLENIRVAIGVSILVIGFMALVGAIATILKGYAFLSIACSALSIASFNIAK